MGQLHFTERLNAYQFVLSCTGGIVLKLLIENVDCPNVAYPMCKVLDLSNCNYTSFKKELDACICNIFRIELNRHTSSYIFANP